MKFTVVTRQGLSADSLAEIEYGWSLVSALKAFGVGRTLAVKKRSVLSVETFEGPAEVIRRGGGVANGPFVILLSCAGTGEDSVPISPSLIEALAETSARVLAADADYPIVDRAEVIRLADEKKIVIALIAESSG